MATAIALKIAPVVESRDSDQILEHSTNLVSASEDEQDSGDEEKHEKLLKEITSLSSHGKKRLKVPSLQRSEPNKTVSEFHLSDVKGADQQVQLSDLIGSLTKSSEHGNLKKKLDSMQRNSGTLDVPVTKPEAQKIQRIIAYGETKKDIEKWAPTVKKNREAEHLSFPLQQYTPPEPSIRGIAFHFKPRTPLEEEVAAVLRGSSHVLERNNKELTEEEEKALLAMDLNDAKERRHELQKLRALQSYYEAKCRRMKKIKSKKYHRVKRKSEMRAATKMAEGEGPANNSETEVLEKADKLRAMERVSLKHRNTSKWAKHLMTKGSKNAEAKKLLQEQLRISRTLTEKKAVETDSDEEVEETGPGEGTDGGPDESDAYGNLLTSEDNPWRLDTKGTPQLAEVAASSLDDDSSTKLHRLQPISSKEATEVGDPDSESGNDEEKSEDEFELELIQPVDKGRGKSSQQNCEGTKKNKKRKSESKAEEVHGTEKKSKKSKKTRNTNTKKRANENSDVDSCAINEDALLKKKKKGKQTKKKKLVSKSTGKTINDEVEIVNSNDTAHKQETEDSTWTIGLADVNGNRKNNTDKEDSGTETKDVCVDPKKIFRIEDQGDVAGKGESDSLRQKRIDIQQAFANDDVVEEFMKEKNAIEEASKPNDIDLSLPGWGSWAGAGIKPSTRRKQLFTKKANPPPPRKDKDMSHVIINEEKSKFFARNQVSAVPHPYGNHVLFERSMRNPVGKQWNTGTTVNQLTKPRVSTLIGTVIEPIKATKEIKRSKPEDRKKKNNGEMSAGITIHS